MRFFSLLIWSAKCPHWLLASGGNGIFLMVWGIISCGCHDKLPQTQWLKTTEIYSLHSSGGRGHNQFHWTSSKVFTRLYSFQKLQEGICTLPLSNFSGCSIPCLVAELLQFSRSASSHLHLLLLLLASVVSDSVTPLRQPTRLPRP